jgi:hypothetical protein
LDVEGINERTVLKWILKKEMMGAMTEFYCLRIEAVAGSCELVMNIWVP